MKKESIFNLQIPISKELEHKLRVLADKDERKLRTYCRRILQAHADEYIKDTPVVEQLNYNVSKEEIAKVEQKINQNKKKKVGALIKK